MPEQLVEASQPTFPNTSIGMLPDGSGIQVTTMISATAGIVQILPEAAMNEICKNWVESRRQLKKHHELIADILATKAK